MLTQLEQYANYEHSTNSLTRLVQLQRYRSGIRAIFGLILAKSVAVLKVFRGIPQSLQANAVEVPPKCCIHHSHIPFRLTLHGITNNSEVLYY